MTMTDFSIVLAGFGGQGILSAGRIITAAALAEGREVSWFPSYGPEMRGGTANCSVVISYEPIGSPIIAEADVLIALNGPSLDKFASIVKPGGLIILDSTLVPHLPARKDVRVFPIPASGLASEQGNMAFAAVILLGCLMEQTACFRRDSFAQALADTLPARHHHLIPTEMQAFDQGRTFPPAG